MFKGSLYLVILLFSYFSHASLINKNVLILHSYHHGYKWTDDIHQGIIEKLNSTHQRLSINIQYMDSKRYATEGYFDSLLALYKQKFARQRFDVVIVSDDNALNFVLKYREELFNKVPIVFCGVNNFDISLVNRVNGLTGVVEDIDLRDGVGLAISLHPNAKHMVFIADMTTTGQKLRTRIDDIIATLPRRIKYSILGDTSHENLLEQIKQLPSDTVLYQTLYLRDINNKYLTHNQLVQDIQKVSKLPLYGSWDFYLGDGIIGGLLASGVYQGKEAARLALAVLSGKAASQLPVVLKSPNKYMFDYRQLERVGLDVSHIPDADIINQPESIYHKYRYYLGFMALLLLASMSLIILQRKHIREQAIVETDLKEKKRVLKELNTQLDQRVEERTNELRQSNEKLKDSLHTLEQMQRKLVESEKMASLGGVVMGIAHEINTPLGISLTGISFLGDKTVALESDFKLGTLSAKQMEAYLEESKINTSLIQKNLNRTAELINSFKQISVNKDSEHIELFDLSGYLESLVKSQQSEIEADGHTIRVSYPSSLKVNSYPNAFNQIINQLIANSRLHGFKDLHHCCIDITIEANEEAITIIYQDTGHGIPEDATHKLYEPFYTTRRGECSGLGLHIVYNLVTQLFEGTIEYQNNGGALFRLILPIPKVVREAHKGQ